MSKHNVEYMRLKDIVVMIDESSSDAWYDIMGVKIPGLKEAQSALEALEPGDEREEDLFAEVNRIEEDYLQEHGGDWYLVSWPDLVTIPRFNSDASYQPQ